VLPAGLRLAHDKQVAIAVCDGEIMRAASELDRLMAEGSVEGLDVEDAAELGPLAVQVVDLRMRRRRLEKELRAIASEWT
jgi:hypothetical protein